MKRHQVILTISAVLFTMNAASATELTGTLKKINDLGSITIGHRESSIPFSYYDDKQNVVGYAMDICSAVVDAVRAKINRKDIKLKLAPVTSANRIPLLANGTIDLECGSTGNLKERNEQVAFSNTYFISSTRFLSKKSANIKGVDDLRGKPVASTAGTGNLQDLIKANTERKLNVRVLTSPDHAEGFLMLETDRIAAFVLDDILLASLAATSKTPNDYVISEEGMSQVFPYAPMLRKDDPDFLKVVNDATAALYKSERIKDIYRKWFLQPIPPGGMNLNFDLPPQLARALANPNNTWDPAAYK